MQVNLALFLHWYTPRRAPLLVAVLGKLPAALVSGPSVDRATVALGMLPRGEVALLFVGVGKALGVIDDALFAALVTVVILLALGSALALRRALAPLPPQWD